MTAGGSGQRLPSPPILSALYLLRPRLRRSPQARILFWASMCVRFPALSPSMLSTQSPTATPACAALPPGVSCGQEWSESLHGCTPKLHNLPPYRWGVRSSLWPSLTVRTLRANSRLQANAHTCRSGPQPLRSLLVCSKGCFTHKIALHRCYLPVLLQRPNRVDRRYPPQGPDKCPISYL